MTNTSRETRPETRHPTMSHHGNLRPRDPKIPQRRGYSTYNALAFNTLLSSQETSATPSGNFRFPSGATLKHYSGASWVSTRFPESFQDLADIWTIPPPAALHRRELHADACHPRKQASGGAPGPDHAFRRTVPRGAYRTLRVTETFVKSRDPHSLLVVSRHSYPA